MTEPCEPTNDTPSVESSSTATSSEDDVTALEVGDLGLDGTPVLGDDDLRFLLSTGC